MKIINKFLSKEDLVDHLPTILHLKQKILRIGKKSIGLEK